MKKRKLKFFSLIMSLILVLVSVPLSVSSEEISEIDASEKITEFQSYTNNVEPGDIFVSQEFERRISYSYEDKEGKLT